MTARIAPLAPPYAPEVQLALEKWMPKQSALEPLKLFRTLARHEHLSDRMRGLGAALLGSRVLAPRVRELLILRTCARCGAEYEWGVHAAAFGASAGLEREVIAATFERSPAAVATCSDPDALVLRLADELHADSTLSAELWQLLSERFGEEELLEMIAVVGFYHLISYITNAIAIEREAWAWIFPRH